MASSGGKAHKGGQYGYGYDWNKGYWPGKKGGKYESKGKKGSGKNKGKGYAKPTGNLVWRASASRVEKSGVQETVRVNSSAADCDDEKTGNSAAPNYQLGNSCGSTGHVRLKKRSTKEMHYVGDDEDNKDIEIPAFAKSMSKLGICQYLVMIILKHLCLVFFILWKCLSLWSPCLVTEEVSWLQIQSGTLDAMCSQAEIEHRTETKSLSLFEMSAETEELHNGIVFF